MPESWSEPEGAERVRAGEPGLDEEYPQEERDSHGSGRHLR